MANARVKRIDVYLAGAYELDGTVQGIRAKVYRGAAPDIPGGGRSSKASNFPTIYISEPLPVYFKEMTWAVRSMASAAVKRGRNAISRRKGRD